MTPLALLALSLASAPAQVHAEHAAEALGATARPFVQGPHLLPDPTPGPDAVVYGYQAYWNADLAAVPWDHLSHLAIFDAHVTPTGALEHTSRWAIASEAVEIAALYGVRVHLCITNFDTGELETLLGSPAARQDLIDALVGWVADTGAHGVNVDFENLPASRRSHMVQFIQDLEAAVGEVVIATPSVDWHDAWDFATLTDHADLFLMGYGYHWSGSEVAGPNDPLYGGDPWHPWSLDGSVQTYLEQGADPDRVILGLPLYGFRWPVVSGDIPSATTGTGSSIVWAAAHEEAAIHGRSFEPHSRTPWWYDGAQQGWYGDTDSLQERVAYALDEGLAGIGFWALHYDGRDAALWEMVAAETTVPGEPETAAPAGDWIADAGPPFLAYPGDTIVLSGALSQGPGALSYRWSQVAGPEVDLDDPAALEPSFRARWPGTHVFALEVGDGETWSAPARSHVVVLDPKAGSRYLTCGCASAPGPVSGLVVLLLGALARRRA